MAIVKQRTNSIDLFRYVCAVMVVIIHSSFYYTWEEVGFFIGTVLPRIAVPFFFAVSGRFYIRNLEDGKKVFWKQIRHLLTIYALWALIYMVFNFISSRPQDILAFLKDKLVAFVVYGYPGHFWFFPAIIIATCLVTLFYKLKLSRLMLPFSLVLYIIGCLGCAYIYIYIYEIGIKIPFLGALFQSPHFETIRRIFLMGFPFFCAGTIRLKKLSTKSVHLLFVLSCIIFIAEIYLVTYLELAANVILTFGLYFLVICTLELLFRHPLPQCQKSAATARTIANFTYYSHPLFNQSIPLIGTFLGFKVPSLLLFLATIVLTFSLGFLCHALIVKKKIKFIQYLVG